MLEENRRLLLDRAAWRNFWLGLLGTGFAPAGSVADPGGESVLAGLMGDGIVGWLLCDTFLPWVMK